MLIWKLIIIRYSNIFQGFAKKKDADLCKIIRVVEGAELEEFKYLFHNWPEPNSCRISAKNRVGKNHKPFLLFLLFFKS